MTDISKSEVLAKLESIEKYLYPESYEGLRLCYISDRLRHVFNDLYVKGLRPEDSEILVESYKLLQKTGIYYNKY